MKISDTKYLKSEERSFAVYEVLGQSPTWIIRNGTYIMLFVTAILFLFSYIIKYPDTIKGTFTLTSGSSPQRIIPSLSGKIKLFIRDGEYVSKGKILGMLDNSADLNNVMEIKRGIDSMLNDYSKNLFNNSYFNYNKKHKLGIIQSGYEDLIKALKSSNLTNSLHEKEVQVKFLEEQIVALRKMDKNFLNQKKLALKDFDYARKKSNIDSTLYNKKVLSKSEYDRSKNDLLSYQKVIQQADETIIQNNVSILQLQKQINELRISKLQNSEDAKNDILTKANKVLSDIESWEDKFLFITSISGMINFSKPWQNGDYVTNEELLVIIPSLSNTYGIAYVPSNGIGKIKINQKAYITLDGYPNQEYGNIIGIVKSISVVKHNNNYLIKISLPDGTTTTYKKKLIPKQELTGTINIVTSDLRLIERIFNQIRSLFLNN